MIFAHASFDLIQSFAEKILYRGWVYLLASFNFLKIFVNVCTTKVVYNSFSKLKIHRYDPDYVNFNYVKMVILIMPK